MRAAAGPRPTHDALRRTRGRNGRRGDAPCIAGTSPRETADRRTCAAVSPHRQHSGSRRDIRDRAAAPGYRTSPPRAAASASAIACRLRLRIELAPALEANGQEPLDVLGALAIALDDVDRLPMVVGGAHPLR